MNLKGKNVLITGAGGFIGHLAEMLVSLGANVSALVKYNSRSDYGFWDNDAAVIDSTEVLQGDLRDSDTIQRHVKNKDVIFHLGALIAIPYSYMSPREVIETP